jgi:hypothetical protein
MKAHIYVFVFKVPASIYMLLSKNQAGKADFHVSGSISRQKKIFVRMLILAAVC